MSDMESGYPKYKANSSALYGAGQYVAHATSIANFYNGTEYEVDEYAPSYAFDKLSDVSSSEAHSFWRVALNITAGSTRNITLQLPIDIYPENISVVGDTGAMAAYFSQNGLTWDSLGQFNLSTSATFNLTAGLKAYRFLRISSTKVLSIRDMRLFGKVYNDPGSNYTGADFILRLTCTKMESA
jgi:hypothetical protein